MCQLSSVSIWIVNSLDFYIEWRICWLKTNLYQEISCLKHYYLNENFIKVSPPNLNKVSVRNGYCAMSNKNRTRAIYKVSECWRTRTCLFYCIETLYGFEFLRKERTMSLPNIRERTHSFGSWEFRVTRYSLHLMFLTFCPLKVVIFCGKH